MTKVCELEEVQLLLTSTQKELASVTNKLSQFASTAALLKELNFNWISLNRHELSLCENKLRESSYSLAMDDIRTAEVELEGYKKV